MEEKALNTNILKDKLIKKYFKMTIFLISLSLIFMVFKFREIPPEVPLFYSLPWGEKQLANKFFLFLLPLFSIITLLVNRYLAMKIKEEILISRLLIIGAFLFSLLSTITLFKIVLLFVHWF